jgi:hypothetical protein
MYVPKKEELGPLTVGVGICLGSIEGRHVSIQNSFALIQTSTELDTAHLTTQLDLCTFDGIYRYANAKTSRLSQHLNLSPSSLQLKSSTMRSYNSTVPSKELLPTAPFSLYSIQLHSVMAQVRLRFLSKSTTSHVSRIRNRKDCHGDLKRTKQSA